MHKADAYTSGISQRLVDSTFFEAFVKGLCPTSYPDHLFHLARHCACQSVKQDININMSVGNVK